MFLSIYKTDWNGNKIKITERNFIKMYGDTVLRELRQQYNSQKKGEFLSINCEPGNPDSVYCQFDVKSYYPDTKILYVQFVGIAR